MRCPKCGYENQEDAKFCKSCGENLQTVSSSNNPISESKSNNKLLIICATVIICVIIIAGAFILLNSDSHSSANVNNNGESGDSAESSDNLKNADNSDDVSSSSSGISLAQAASYFPEASDTVLGHVFDEADENGDGLLSESELNLFYKVRDHTKKYAYNIKNSFVTDKPSSNEKTGYCADHGRVAVVNGNECPICHYMGYSDTRTKTSAW